MQKELDNHLDKKINGLLQDLHYQLESLCWVISTVESIRYLISLKKKFNNKSDIEQ